MRLHTPRLIARWSTKAAPEDPQIVGAIEAALPALPADGA
jgi:hypothetical protein